MHLLFVSCFILVGCWATYDLIDPTPECYTLDLCQEYGEWGLSSSIHPNSEERALYTLINFARMYPDEYKSSEYGEKLYGTFGPSWEYDNVGDCAQASSVPYYWLSSANQAARFSSWDCQNCDDGSCGHSTCTNPNRCDLFGDDCGAAARMDAFLVNDYSKYGIKFDAEGLCGANLCYSDGHCSAIFDSSSRIFGVGFHPGSNGYTLDYTTGYKDDILDVVSYSIVNVAHFDERIKINSANYDSDDKYMVFMLQYFNENVTAANVWVVYNGNQHLMTRDWGDQYNGFYRARASV